MNLNQSATSEIHVNESRNPIVSTSFSSSLSDITVPDDVIDEEMFLKQKGYKTVRKICATLQGALFEGRSIDASNQKVAIKRTHKSLHQQRIAKIDEDHGILTLCVEENIVKEALLLNHLTVANKSTAGYIVQYIDSFESNDYLYLIVEYIDSDINFKQFIEKAHKYIRDGKLKKKEFYKVVKFLFWQLMAVVNWMHNDMHCCHLDLTLDNVMLENATFIRNKDGSISINSNIYPKLIDFGRSELFTMNSNNPFACDKHSLLDTIQYASPQLDNEQIYDARSQDCWSLGMMLYHCVVIDICDNQLYNGYMAIQNGQLMEYLHSNRLNSNKSNKLVDLLNNVLNVHESRRYSIMDILKHEYFMEYFKKYRKRIAKKSKTQRKKLLLQQDKLAQFPYYTINATKHAFV